MSTPDINGGARRRRHSRRVRRQAAVLAMMIPGALGLANATASASGLSIQQWSMRFLAQMGSPARSPRAPRVEFLERWANVEDTFARGNPNNPLDTKMSARGAQLYNSAGVKKYPTPVVGFEATLSTLRQSFDDPILDALSNPNATMAMLGLALAESNWTGFGPRSWNEQFYASAVSGLPMSSFQLPEPTVSIRGVVVNPLKKRVGDVCVVALIRGHARLKQVYTAANGSYNFEGLPRAAYRLEISGCHHVLSNAPVTFYDSKATPQYTIRVRARATVLSGACSMNKACLSQRITVGHVITFGIMRPVLTWRRPAAISYGTRLSKAQLNAAASVPGKLHYSIRRGTRLDPGTHLLFVVFEPRDRANYVSVRAAEVLVVDRFRPLLRWQHPAPLVQGTPLSATQLDAVAPVSGKFTYVPPAGTVLPAGAHSLVVRFRPFDRKRYRMATRRIRIDVLSAPSS